MAQYNSENFKAQKKRPPQGLLYKVIKKGKIFSFTKSNDAISISTVRDANPSSMRESMKDHQKEMFWDNNRLIFESLSGWSSLYFLVVGLTKIALIVFLPILYSFSLISILLGDGTLETESSYLAFVSLYLLAPSLLIYIHYKLIHKGHMNLAPFLRPILVFEANRENGSITSYKENGEIDFTHPFIEFDCILISVPSPQGHLNYSLALTHRYNDYPSSVPIGDLIGKNEMVDEYHRLWNMIQRYMDVSQPMPDIMVLESSREQDPTTAAYDKKNTRNPRYWRDMTDEEFEITIERIRKEQEGQPSSGPEINIFENNEPPEKYEV
ncbi:hypothetical protein [Enterovibrio norvegicus]|uniref:Uncharacterized protein n=1 Tax=Enterovibrio norvegicus TaxID=188144 RepID=A0A2N7L3R3_9GAMM|nr:hypothetical protein [Enterovibrio norvegicus]PMN87965.1 hypothetical protein BCT23_24255 [Enterovibrio norvegicus]